MPAIALTAFARSEERTRSLQAGFQLHVAKPVEEAELVAAIASLARLGPGAQAEREPVATQGDPDQAA
jgi:CheY-like chemotaxis protein